MRGLEWKTVLTAAIAGFGLFVATGAQAHDDDRWRWEHRHHRDRDFVDHDHWRHEPERRVVVERQPVVVQRPVVMAPAPVFVQPALPAYSQPADPSLNFNFSFPLR